MHATLQSRRLVKLRREVVLMKLHIRANGCHIRSHYHPTKVKVKTHIPLTPARGRQPTGSRSDGRLSWPRWLVTYRYGLSTHRPTNWLATCWSQVWRLNHYTSKPPVLSAAKCHPWTSLSILCNAWFCEHLQRRLRFSECDGSEINFDLFKEDRTKRTSNILW